MKRTFTRNALPSFAAALCCLASAHADALDARRVPAEVRWFAHVDVDALNRSTFADALRTGGALDLGPDPFGVGAELGVDVLRDLRSFTVFTLPDADAAAQPVRVEGQVDARAGGEGTRVALGVVRADVSAAGTQVALFVCRPRVDEALARLAARPGHRTDTLDGRPLHAWAFGGETLYAWVGDAQVAGEPGASARVIVQANDKVALARALAVFEGRAPNLADAPDPALRARPSEGSFLFASASTRLAELDGLELASSVARLAEDFVLDLGETRGAVFARLSVDAGTEREALQIQQVLQGGIALLGLVAGGDADDAELRAIQALSSSFRFESRGKTVHADFELAVPTFLAALGALGAGADDRAREPEKK